MATINILPKVDEVRFLSINYNEGLRMLGYEAEVLIPRSIELPEYGYTLKKLYQESDRYLAYLNITQNASMQMLNALGWNAESSTTKPMVITFARYLQRVDNELQYDNKNQPPNDVVEVKPTIYTILHLKYDYNDLGKDFKITKVVGNSLSPVYWTCTVVPIRITIEPEKQENENINSDHLDIISPTGDSRETIFPFDSEPKTEESKKSGFKYLNIGG